jgi:ribosomal protein S18 acetylase RimI-like enzyme
MLHAEKMRTEDFSFAVQLANTMDWNMAESDFQFMTKLEPDGCFVLFQAKEPIGVATCISYGKTGWFGNLAIKEEHRKKGAGTTLVKHAIEYLRRRRVETVGLYAYSHLVGFYEKIGFKPHDDLVVLNGKQSSSKPQKTVKEACKKDVAALIDFDKRCFGWDRKKLLGSVLLEKSNSCFFSCDEGDIKGFVAAKTYENMAEMGPLVCSSETVAVELVKAMLFRLARLDIYVYAPEKQKALIGTFLEVGLKKDFSVKRMFLGPPVAQSCAYLPESLERG